MQRGLVIPVVHPEDVRRLSLEDAIARGALLVVDEAVDVAVQVGDGRVDEELRRHRVAAPGLMLVLVGDDGLEAAAAPEDRTVGHRLDPARLLGPDVEGGSMTWIRDAEDGRDVTAADAALALLEELCAGFHGLTPFGPPC